MNENGEHEGKLKETTEKFWGKTRKTFHSAAFKANQYKRVVQKKIDVGSIHKKISHAHSELGKLIDDAREAGDRNVLERDEVQKLFAELDELKSAAAALEVEIEAIKAEEPPEEEEEETPGETSASEKRSEKE